MLAPKHTSTPMLLQNWVYKERLKKVTVNVLNGQVETFETSPIEIELKSINGNLSTKITAFTANRVTGNMPAFGSTMQVPEGVPNRRVQGQLLEIAQEHCLAQVVNIHTVKIRPLICY